MQAMDASLIQTIQETRTQTAKDRNEAMLVLEDFGHSVDSAQTSLTRAQEQAQNARLIEEASRRKHRDLLNHLNALTEKPQALFGKLDQLQADVMACRSKTGLADDAVTACQEALNRARGDLTVAQSRFDRFDKALKELDIHISQMN
jgi:chromosome segregation ATPase